MPWYNPISWFRRAGKASPDQVVQDVQFSRRARDSTNIPMDVVVTMRMPDELRERGARKARELGFGSLSEYMRSLLAQSLDEGGDAVAVSGRKKAMRNDEAVSP